MIRDSEGNARRHRERRRIALHATKDLTECAMQSAELALERSVALSLLVRVCGLYRVPGRVHERHLLCKQQQHDVHDVGEIPSIHDRAFAVLDASRFVALLDSATIMPQTRPAVENFVAHAVMLDD